MYSLFGLLIEKANASSVGRAVSLADDFMAVDSLRFCQHYAEAPPDEWPEHIPRASNSDDCDINFVVDGRTDPDTLIALAEYFYKLYRDELFSAAKRIDSDDVDLKAVYNMAYWLDSADSITDFAVAVTSGIVSIPHSFLSLLSVLVGDFYFLMPFYDYTWRSSCFSDERLREVEEHPDRFYFILYKISG